MTKAGMAFDRDNELQYQILNLLLLRKNRPWLQSCASCN